MFRFHVVWRGRFGGDYGMPSATPMKTQERIVELRKAGKTYSQIQKETGAAGPVISKVLKKAGLTQSRSGTETLAPSESVPATTAPAPSVGTASDWLKEFQPPAVKEKPRVERYKADCCGVIFTLDEGEKLADVTACPAGCGGVP